MAITRLNQYSATFATTVNPSVTWTNATNASDVLIVFVLHNHSASSTTVTAPAGGGGEATWTALTAINGAPNVAQSCSIGVWWSTGTALSAAHVSTWTLGTVTRDSVTWALQYSGVQTASPVDQQGPGNFQNVVSTAWDSGTSSTTTNANDVLLSVAGLSNNSAGENLGAFGTQVPASWTAVVSALKSPAGTATQGITFYGWENIVSATSAPHLAATAAVSALWAGTTLAMKATAAVDTPRKPVFFASRARGHQHPQTAIGRSAWR